MKLRVRIIVGWILLLLLGTSSIVLADGLTLEQWIESALTQNLDYQLTLQDHQLVLEQLGLEKNGGLGGVQFSMTPVAITDKGLPDQYGLGLSYGWRLPNDMYISGNNSLKVKTDGDVTLSGGLGLNLNLIEFLESEKDEELKDKYLAEEKRLFSAKSSIIKEVVEQYYTLRITAEQLEIIRSKLTESQRILERQQGQLAAGLIAELDLTNMEDQHQALLDNYEKTKEALGIARRNFAWLFGKLELDEQMLSALDWIQSGEHSPLQTMKVNQFLAKWDIEQVETYLYQITTYQEGLAAVEAAEKNLDKARKANDWDVTLGSQVSYQIGQDSSFSASIGVSKTLYDPTVAKGIKQAEINLERAKLSLEEQSNQLIFRLIDQVEAIQKRQADLKAAENELPELIDQLERIMKQYDLGIVSLNDVEKIRLKVMEQHVQITQLQRDLDMAKLNLGDLLYIHDSYK